MAAGAPRGAGDAVGDAEMARRFSVGAVLPRYFNFASDRGLALHQYALSGRPASHGCIRLLAVDAKWLYRCGEGWRFNAETMEPVRAGTLLVLVGRYDFASPQPWLNREWRAGGIGTHFARLEDPPDTK